jgi:ribulose-phosphate 3-epimerase
MIERPEDQIAEFAHAGSDNITVGAKAAPHVHCALPAMREAGWSGAQGLIAASVGKLEPPRDSLPDSVARDIDGGIQKSSAPRVVGAGANLLVTGLGFFGSADPAAAYRSIAVAERVR